MPPTRSRARPKRPVANPGPRPLSRARIVAGALALIERTGLDGFSTRKLGAALGVEAMALYHHVPSKNALLDAVAERLILTVALPPETLPWRDWMKRVATAYRRMGLKHPNAFPLLVTRRYRARGGFAFFEANLRVLSKAGFTLRAALRLTRTIGSFVNGLLLAEIAGGSGRRGDRMARALPPDLPLLNKAAPYINSAAMDGAFEYGLDLILRAAEPRK